MGTEKPIEQLVKAAIELGGHRLPDSVEVGRETIESGWFAMIADRLNLPWRYIARCLDVEPPVLRRWVRGTHRPNRISCLKIAIFRQCVDDLMIEVDPTFWLDAMPVKSMAMVRGVGVEFLEDLCQTGLLECVDLGVLGKWVTANETEMAAYRRARRKQIDREKDR